MSSLVVRNIEEDLVTRLKQRATAHGRSAEAEHREILRYALTSGTGFDELAAQMRALTAERRHTPSELIQREMRDEA